MQRLGRVGTLVLQWRVGVVAGAMLVAFLACVSDSPSATPDAGSGGEGQACFANGTCITPLTCVSKVCVRLGGDAAVDAAVDAEIDASDGGPAGPASCAGGGLGRNNCGSGSESCCANGLVTAGSFDRTYANDGGGASGKADPASVAAFRLDKYEITVGRFRQYVAAWKASWVPPPGSGKHSHLNGGLGLINSGADGGVAYEPGWNASNNVDVAPTDQNLMCDGNNSTWTSAPGTHENLPINCVNWYEASAFCIWDGGFLPSEAEWEYAAAGGAQERAYPWGATAPGTANQYAIFGDGAGGCYFPSGLAACSDVKNVAPVGSTTLGAGAFGQFDLGGNVWEWTRDWSAPYVTPCADCAYMTAQSGRVIRGGYFKTTSAFLQPAVRGVNNPQNHLLFVGARCARTP